MHSGAGCLQGQGTAGLPRCDCQGVGGHDEVRLCARGCAWATCPHSAHRCRRCFPPSTCVMPAAEIQWPCRYCARGIALVFGHQPTSPVRASEPSELICKGQVCRSLGSLNERIYRDTVWFIRMLRLGESSACPRSFCFWSDAYIHSPQTLITHPPVPGFGWGAGTSLDAAAPALLPLPNLNPKHEPNPS